VDTAHRGDLAVGHAAEVVQLDDPRLGLVRPGEFGKRLIERDQIPRPIIDHRAGLVELARPIARTALLGAAAARMVDQDLAHVARCDREEMCAVFELERRAIGEPEIGLRDQIGRAERVVWPLAAEMKRGRCSSWKISSATSSKAARSPCRQARNRTVTSLGDSPTLR
jgi:hypothetical protein